MGMKQVQLEKPKKSASENPPAGGCIGFFVIIFSMLCASCEGSRTRRMIDAYGNAYDEYEKTGDPTLFIIMTIVGIVLGVIWIMKKADK